MGKHKLKQYAKHFTSETVIVTINNTVDKMI